MRYFLDKLQGLFKWHAPDAKIIGEVKLRDDHTPYFTVKMEGCRTLIDVSAEDIIDKFPNKFNQHDIKNATKSYMKYRCCLRLALIEKNFAVLHHHQNNSYQLVDLTDSLFLRHLDMDALRAEDAFKLGIQFEKVQSKKDKKLFSSNKVKNKLIPFTLVKTDEPI